MFPNVCSTKLRIVYRLDMSKTAVLDTHHLNLLHVQCHVMSCIVCMVVAIPKGEQPGFIGGGPPPEILPAIVLLLICKPTGLETVELFTFINGKLYQFSLQ